MRGCLLGQTMKTWITEAEAVTSAQRVICYPPLAQSLLPQTEEKEAFPTTYQPAQVTHGANKS